jgi:hypothetical protein
MPGIQDLFFDRLLNIVVQDIGNLLKVPYVFFSGYNQNWRLDLFELLNGGWCKSHDRILMQPLPTRVRQDHFPQSLKNRRIVFC